MKKVVIDAREADKSGPGRYVYKMIEYLHALKPDFRIVLLAKKQKVDFLRGIAPDFEIVETPYKEFTFGEQIGFKKQIDGLKPDLVHFPMVQQPVWYQGKVVTTMQDLTTVRFKNPSKNPVVFWVKQQVYKWVNKRAARKSDKIITPSEFVRDDVADYCGIDSEKITVTYESSDPIPDTPAPLPDLQNNSFIMYLGRPTPHKNLPRLIEAFQVVQKTHPFLRLVLCGKKDVLYERIEQDVKNRGIKNVLFTGFISEGQLRWLYENCQAYVFPSLSEGFGLPALEAMRHGAPVVSTNATCSPEIYQGAAYYFDPRDVPEMAQKITDVLDNKKLRKELITAGTMHAKSFSWQRMAKQTLEVYKTALGD